jgi:hypothetical protein
VPNRKNAWAAASSGAATARPKLATNGNSPPVKTIIGSRRCELPRITSAYSSTAASVLAAIRNGNPTSPSA